MIAPPASSVGSNQSPRSETALATDSSTITSAAPATSRAGQELLRLSQKSDAIAASPRLHDGTSKIVIATQLSGKFFVSESPWAQSNRSSAESVELTCYRRNLFNVYGVVVLPGNFTPFVIKNGERKRIVGLSAQLLALESLNDRTVKLVCIPERRASSAEQPPPYTEHRPVTLDVDLRNDCLPSAGKFPVSWNRLQFRHATAKNQRRGTSQQTYRLQVFVVATLEDDSAVTISKAVSIPIVVRGSSPGSFQSRKDATLQHKPARATSTSQKATSLQESTQQTTLVGWDAIFGAQESDLNTHNGHDDTPGVYNDLQYQAYSNGTTMYDDPGLGTRATYTALSENSSPENVVMADTNDAVAEETPHTYEYYPLSIDDWTIPIEAIYRPHYIHQQETGLERIQASNGGSSRRFYKRISR